VMLLGRCLACAEMGWELPTVPSADGELVCPCRRVVGHELLAELGDDLGGVISISLASLLAEEDETGVQGGAAVGPDYWSAPLVHEVELGFAMDKGEDAETGLELDARAWLIVGAPEDLLGERHWRHLDEGLEGAAG
jgi:hypothetical protein